MVIGMGKPITLEELAELRAGVSGVVLARGDAGLAQEAACFNTAVVHDPDVVIGVRSADDMLAAVTFAARHRLPVYVQATGHGAFAPITEGVLITTRRMSAVSVDASRRIATIGAGARWGAVVERRGTR
jgi:FAD/FMN-containing dehydrogenase